MSTKKPVFGTPTESGATIAVRIDHELSEKLAREMEKRRKAAGGAEISEGALVRALLVQALS